MIYEYKKSEQSPIDFDFSGRFIPGDSLASVVITFSPASGVSEISGKRVLAGAVAQLRFDASSAVARTVYHVFVKGTSAIGDTYTLEADLIIIPDSSPEHD
jgi:hypothetical protein